MEIKQCGNCQAEIKVSPSKIRPLNFCSQSCFIEHKKRIGFHEKENNVSWTGGPVVTECETCGKEFEIKKSALLRGRGKYCSKDCMFAGKFEIRKCAICGTETRIKKSHLEHRGDYCSIECRSIGYKQNGTFKGENNPRYIDGQSQTKENECRRTHKRRVELAENGGDYTLEEWADLCEKYDNKCLCCGKSNVKLTVDHVIPVSKGGQNTIENIQPLCKSCNSKKRTSATDYR